jgi:starch-binding outer membrane protein, SusD/RagB family
MKKNILLIITTASLLFTACKKNLLDTQIQQNFSEDLFLNSGPTNLKAFGMGVYDYLPQMNRFGGNALLAAGSDEADYARFNNLQRFNAGAWDPFTNPDDVWATYYRGIRHANLFLEKTTDFRKLLVVDTINNKANYLLDVDDFIKLRAEARFLRAYYYMELIKRYGGVPLVKNVINENEAFGVTRSTFQQCVDYIVEQCDSSYLDLTNHYINYGIPAGQTIGRGDAGSDNNRLGRIEKPAAVALKLRALLYAASPLNNPGGNVTSWQKAAEAAQQLFTDPNCAHVNFLNTAYRDLFMAQNTTNNLTPRKGANSGIILTRPFQLNSNTFERANYPVGMVNGGEGATCPSQNLVDAFEMRTTGLPIADAASGYDANNPYANRDQRLGWIVVLNGSTMGLNTNNTARIVESFTGGADAIGAKEGATTTGYYLRKLCVENYNLSLGGTRAKAWILMRFGEVLLNYAEAANEAFGPEAKPVLGGTAAVRSAREAINLVRARAGQPAINAGITQTQLRDRIRNERRVELAFEEHRFFDVRRWKIAEQTETTPLAGMRVTSTGPTTFSYQRFTVEPRIFTTKMYLYPIPFTEISKSNGLITQNPGW